MNKRLEGRIKALEDALQTLAWQHGWGANGKCACAAHTQVEKLGLRFDIPAHNPKHFKGCNCWSH